MFGNLFTQYQKRIAHRRLCIIGLDGIWQSRLQ